jgi:hypothetical protein
MKFIDVLYLVCSHFYRKRDTFKLSGLILLIGVFMMNILLFFFFLIEDSKLKLIDKNYFFINRYYIVFGSISIIGVLTYIRYFLITNYDEIDNWFNSLDDTQKNRRYLLAVLYILISFGSCGGYAIYSGGTVNGWW